MQPTQAIPDDLHDDPIVAGYLRSKTGSLERICAADEEGGEADRPKLDHWTLPDIHASERILSGAAEWGGTDTPSDAEKFCVTVADFGSGKMESTVSYAQDGFAKRVSAKRKKVAGPRERLQRNQADIDRSLRRTKKIIRHKILMMRPDKMITCTTAEPIVHIDDFTAIVTEFFRLCRAEFNDFKYLAVFERHDSSKTQEANRYSFHMHFATVGYMDYNKLRHFWRATVAKHRGTEYEASNVNGSFAQKSCKSSSFNRSKMAGYMSKYVAKDVEYGDPCKKRYWASQNISKPVVTRVYFSTASKPYYFFRRVIEDVTGAQIAFGYAPPRETGSFVPVFFFSSG